MTIERLTEHFDRCEHIEEETWSDLSWLKTSITDRVYFLLEKQKWTDHWKTKNENQE